MIPRLTGFRPCALVSSTHFVLLLWCSRTGLDLPKSQNFEVFVYTCVTLLWPVFLHGFQGPMTHMRKREWRIGRPAGKACRFRGTMPGEIHGLEQDVMDMHQLELESCALHIAMTMDRGHACLDAAAHRLRTAYNPSASLLHEWHVPTEVRPAPLLQAAEAAALCKLTFHSKQTVARHAQDTKHQPRLFAPSLA